MASTPPSPTTTQPHDASAACAVLTHGTLLSQITGFQRGLSGLVAPLVHRYEAGGWMQRTVVYVRGPQAPHLKHAVPCVVSQVSGRIWPPRQWQVQCALEASAAYDDRDAGFPVLRRLLDAVSLTPTRKARARVREHAHRRVWDAAAAVGRVDVLTWMHATYNCVGAVHVVLRSCVRMALRHGRVSVLEWIEGQFGAKKLRSVMGTPRRCVDASDVAARGHYDVIRWLQDRRWELVVDGAALRQIVECGDVRMLRLLDRGPHKRIARRNHALVAYAVASNQPESLAFLVDECGLHATVRTLERALALGHDAVATCLLEHRDALRRDECGFGPLPFHLLQRIVSHGLVGATVTHRAVQRLLPLYPTDAIAAALVKYAYREHRNGSSQIWMLLEDETLASMVGRALPLTVTAYARRVHSDQLGPLTTAVVRSRRMRTANDNLLFQDEVTRETPAATREDTQDAVLFMLFVAMPWEIKLILERDAATRPAPHCDATFLALCAVLCRYDSYRCVVATVFTDHLRRMDDSQTSK